jgi:hypothetical protein
MTAYTHVDDQLTNFENDLQDTLSKSLLKNINLDYWNELDELDDTSISNVHNLIHQIFKKITITYSYTPVVSILINLKNIIRFSVWSTLNIPVPKIPEYHTQRISENAFEIYLQHSYSILRTEMIMVNHNATLIQRCWRKTQKK